MEAGKAWPFALCLDNHSYLLFNGWVQSRDEFNGNGSNSSASSNLRFPFRKSKLIETDLDRCALPRPLTPLTQPVTAVAIGLGCRAQIRGLLWQSVNAGSLSILFEFAPKQ